MSADRFDKTVRQIIANAVRVAPDLAAEVAHADAVDKFDALDRTPFDVPGARDMGAFKIEGQRDGDLLTGRRIAIGGKVYRFLIWLET